jgi:hypothetical protein
VTGQEHETRIAEALDNAIKFTRKRFSLGTPEKYPATPLYGLRLSEAEAIAAELEAAAERERRKDEALRAAWRAVESLRGYQAVLGKPREDEAAAVARMRGQHFGSHIDAILDHLRVALSAAVSEGEPDGD